MEKKIEKKEVIVSKPKPEYYTVKMEALVPVTLKLRVLAESPEKAIELVRKKRELQMQIEAPKLHLGKFKPLSAIVYKFHQSIVLLTKKF